MRGVRSFIPSPADSRLQILGSAVFSTDAGVGNDTGTLLGWARLYVDPRAFSLEVRRCQPRRFHPPILINYSVRSIFPPPVCALFFLYQYRIYRMRSCPVSLYMYLYPKFHNTTIFEPCLFPHFDTVWKLPHFPTVPKALLRPRVTTLKQRSTSRHPSLLV
jgi:hypothetical protein